MENNFMDFQESPQYFGALYPYIVDESITDIDYNGKTLWLTDCENNRSKRDCTDINQEFVNQFSKRVSNTVSKAFNKQNPVLEAETNTLRITIIHESVAISGRSICIRKSLPFVRMTESSMIQQHYCTPAILELLKGCVQEKKNIVFCGEPGVGKTECAKFFSSYIPANERVITIEDNPEWHYHKIFPERDCVELRINEQMDYTKAIKTCLRFNPKWMMLSEARSTEVSYLMEGFSTGVKGFTTLHTDDVRKVPDRIVNMSGDEHRERLENDVYAFIDVAVLIKRKEFQNENGDCKVYRYIDQIGFLDRKNGANEMRLVVDDGAFLLAEEDKRYSMDKKVQFAMVAEEGGTYGGTKTTVG